MQLLDDICSRECREFACAWDNWRGAELVPRRSSVRIEDISNLLHLISVVEVRSPDEAIFRLAGTALCQAMGVELSGLNYFDFTTPEQRGPRAKRTCALVEHPAGSHFQFPVAYKTGRMVPSEVLSFPVWPDDPNAPPQLFGISVALENTHLEGEVDQPDRIAMPEGFQFVDIGAGVPDNSLGLADRPPAMMQLRKVG